LRTRGRDPEQVRTRKRQVEQSRAKVAKRGARRETATNSLGATAKRMEVGNREA